MDSILLYSIPFKTTFQKQGLGWQNSSADTGACHQLSQPEFKPQSSLIEGENGFLYSVL